MAEKLETVPVLPASASPLASQPCNCFEGGLCCENCFVEIHGLTVLLDPPFFAWS